MAWDKLRDEAISLVWYPLIEIAWLGSQRQLFKFKLTEY